MTVSVSDLTTVKTMAGATPAEAQPVGITFGNRTEAQLPSPMPGLKSGLLQVQLPSDTPTVVSL